MGNIVTPAELLEAGHRGETLRLALLSAHYRQPLAWTEAAVAQAKAMLDRLYRAAGDAEPEQVDDGVVEALADDLNTPLALTRLMALDDPARSRRAPACSACSDRIPIGGSKARPALAMSMRGLPSGPRPRRGAISRRPTAFATSLQAEGIVLEDGPEGTTWRRS